MKQFSEMNPVDLSDYIEENHHAYLRNVFPEISKLLYTITRVHGKSHPELFDVYRLFGQLKAELEPHLIREEILLFPMLEQADESLVEINRIMAEVIMEHSIIRENSAKLRTAAKDYKMPDDVCNTFFKTYSMLEEMEQDINSHLDLEDNVLLKKYRKQ